MSDLTTVRADIKTWERAFKSENGRDPSIQDIKQQPAIAEKYKLYKKLSKAAASTTPALSNLPKSDNPPSTPPSSQPRDSRSSLVLAKPRAIEPTAPLSSFNPFSPQKNKGKQKESIVANVNRVSHSNPFATPAKAKPKPRVQHQSPDPFPPELPTLTFAPTLPPPAPTSALSRARKRLRGEPVSPSPNKDKRRRVDSQTTLQFSKLTESPLDSDEEEHAEAANSSFVDDSPVKAPAGGKSFKLLFTETVPQNQLSVKGKATLARSKTTPAVAGLFGERLERTTSVSAISREDVDWDLGGNLKLGVKETKDRKLVNVKLSAVSSKIIPIKSDLFTEGGLSTQTQPLKPPKATRAGPSKLKPAEIRTSSKRSLSDTEVETVASLNGPVPDTNTTRLSSLLPPSPPPADSSSYRASKHNSTYNGKGKAKAKLGISRKKAKVFDEEVGDEDGDEDEDGVKDGEEFDTKDNNVKVFDRKTRFQRGDNQGEDLDLDSDPILAFAHRGRGRGDGPHGYGSPLASESAEDTGDAPTNGTRKFEIDLPEKLQRVLAFSPSESIARARDSREQLVVKGLLYGRRAGHYDPVKGGEIWDVGEHEKQDEVGSEVEGIGEGKGGADTEGEDEWEGEPVPWEVGEL